MAIKKEKNKHLTDDLRLALEAAIRERKSFSQIKRELGIPRSTTKREIMNHRVESTKVFYGHGFNPCVHRIGCKATGMCARYAADEFNWLWRTLGADTFRRLFPALLKDNGTEFSNPLAIEISPDDGKPRTKVFYARPYTATGKTFVERNHECIRSIVLKCESFDNLTQEQVNLMMSHVNSHVRASLMKGLGRDSEAREAFEECAREAGDFQSNGSYSIFRALLLARFSPRAARQTRRIPRTILRHARFRLQGTGCSFQD